MRIYAQFFSPYSQKYLRVLTEMSTTYSQKYLRVLTSVSTRTHESVYVVLTEVFTPKCACVLKLPDDLSVFNLEVIKDCFIMVLCCEASI